ncbi:MAG: DedA family protein [Pseudomonadota bacterium]|nr:DedA family protein [Pseudomonadota bacterium]
MADLQQLLADYGLLAVFIGTFFEGETVVALAGFAAHQGLLGFLPVAGSAFLGSFLGDQLWFYLGRHHADYAIVRRVTGKPSIAYALKLIDRHAYLFILSFRFLYGLRVVSPVAVGLSTVPARVYLVLNFIAAAIWAVAITSAGYVFGAAVETFFGELKAAEHKLLAALGVAAGMALLYYAVRQMLRRWRANRSGESV